MVAALRATGLCLAIIVLSSAALPSGQLSVGILISIAATVFMLASQRGFWNTDPDICINLMLGVMTGYGVRVMFLQWDSNRFFSHVVPGVGFTEAKPALAMVTARLAIAVGLCLTVALIRGRRRLPSAYSQPVVTTRYRSEVILGLALLWFVLSIVSANRFVASSTLLALVRAMVPSTILLAAAVLERFSSRTGSDRRHRWQLNGAILLLVLAGIAQARQALLVLPIVLWLIVSARSEQTDADEASGHQTPFSRLARLAVVAILVVVAGGWLVNQAESIVKGTNSSSSLSVVDGVASISARLGTLDREMSIATLRSGGPVSTRISPTSAVQTTVARLVPIVSSDTNNSIGRAFAEEVQGKDASQRQEGAWGWIASAVELGGSVWWPLVVLVHIVAVGLLLDLVGRSPHGFVLQLVIGQFLVLQWISSGNLDRLWSTALRETLLGLVLLPFAASAVTQNEAHAEEASDSCPYESTSVRVA